MKNKFYVGVTAMVLTVLCLGGVNKSFSKEMAMSSVEQENISAMLDKSASFSCRWGTREVSNGWEAICIKTGVGYSCECGDVKYYPDLY